MAIVLAWPAVASAQTTWVSDTTGGTWGVAGNWSGGAPTTTGTAVLGNATANRLVITAASGTVGTLSITQTTAGVLNAFQMANPFQVTNAVTLGAASGTAQILVMSTTTANTSGTFSGGITVNAGGVLAAGMYTSGATAYTSNINGNVTVSGGLVDVGRKTGPGTATAYFQAFGNNFAMSSGTLVMGAAATRLLFTGGITDVSAGTVSIASSTDLNPGYLFFTGTSVNFSPATYINPNSPGKTPQMTLDNLGNQTATFGQGWNNILNLRNGGIKTVSAGSQATSFNNLRIRDEISASGTLTLRLGSDLSFTGLTVADSGTTAGSTANFAFDTNGYTMAFASALTPIVSNTLAATNVYNLTGSGTIVAQQFTLNSGSTTVNVGAGLTLTATAAGVNTLSGSGTIDPTSTFRHTASGSSSLVSTRAVGNIEVASGTLGITTLTAGGQAARATGGTLSLAGSGYTFASALVNGGAITSGTLTSAGLFDMRAGTVSAVLAGAGNLAKTTTGTVTLSSANAYAGGSAVNAGRLVVGNAAALGASSGALAVNGGTLDLGGFSVAVGALSGSAGAVITTAAAPGTATLTTSVASGTSIFGGVIQNNSSGLVAVSKTGAGVLDLTGVNTYTGATTVSAGTLLVNGQLGNTAVTVDGGATLGGVGSIGGAVTVNGMLSPGNSPGVLSVAALVLGGSSTALMEIAGTTPGTQYDQIVGLTSGLTYGGTLQLNVSQAFGDNTTFNLFTGFTSFTGNFSSVVSVGSSYGGLTFARIGDVWTSGTAAGNQSLQFDQATGNLVIVPEPGAVALAGIGIVAAGWAIRRRRAR